LKAQFRDAFVNKKIKYTNEVVLTLILKKDAILLMRYLNEISKNSKKALFVRKEEQ